VKSIYLGQDRATGKRIELPVSAFTTHLHLPGATGTGKSTVLFSMMTQLFLDWRNPACHVIVDFLGGLAEDLLLWMSTDRCTQQVRDRLVLLRPAEGGVSMTLNPLLYDDYDQGFFKVNRATELILRAWSAQNLGEQPRLARWLFNSMWAAAQLGLTVADTAHLLIPGSPFHEPLVRALPERLRSEWVEVLCARGGEATRILDSTRNRMKPFHESGILRRMFGSVQNRLDAGRFMREGKILILDLSPRGRLSGPEANAIASLTVNEFLAAARSEPRGHRSPTFLWLDEFQRIVSPDFEYAIPEVRQLNIRLILAHQSFSQLKTENTDLTSLIWQPRTRLAFAEQGDDAELLAQEFASLTYEPKWVKEELYTLRQLQTGHEKVQLSTWGSGMTESRQWQETYGSGRTRSEQSSWRAQDTMNRVRGTGEGESHTSGHGKGTSEGRSQTQGTHEQLVAKLATIEELSSRSYYTFDEQRNLWAQRVRKQRTGQCVLWSHAVDGVRDVAVADPKTGVMTFDVAMIEQRFPEVITRYNQMLEDNFAREWFASPAAIEAETDERLRQVLLPPLVLQAAPEGEAIPESPSPF
jgi:hypothetical protein